MSHRPSTVTVCTAAIQCCLLGMVTFARADNSPETYRQILAKRLPPELGTLSKRSAPDQLGETAGESFLDLLKLRDEPHKEAVPQLAEIVAAHADSTRIHGFAAAQALYATDTDEAREALQKHVLRPEYPADTAINYTSHWEMREPQRSKFIAAYLLRDLSDDLDVSVRARWGADGQRALFVTVKLENASKRPFAVSLDQQYQALALHLRAPSGTFVEKHNLVVYNPQRPHWLMLAAGESTSFEVVLELKKDPESLEKFSRLSGEAAKIEALLSSFDVGFALPESGEYTVYAMIVQTPPSDEQLKFIRDTEGIKGETIWTGRAVSEPEKVKLRLERIPRSASAIGGGLVSWVTSRR